MRRWMTMFAAAVLAACSPAEDAAQQLEPAPVAISPGQRHSSGSAGPSKFAVGASGGVCAATIPYNGGAVMTSPLNVYLIWYGSWSGNSAQTILPALVNALGFSPRWKVDTTFTNGGGTAVTGTVNLKGQFNDAYSQGSSLSQSAVYAAVTRAIRLGAFPADSNGIYLVLTSADVSQFNSKGSFCGTGSPDDYCGWHSWQTYLLNSFGFTIPLKYGFIGNGDRCPSFCTSGLLANGSPNGNRGADGMASVIVHELDETATDPQISAWYTNTATGICENADNCAWSFGGTWPAKNGTTANATIGGREFLIQRNWANYGSGYCTTSWAGTCDGTAGQWSGCRGTGCSVCSELVSNAPCYFRNHPNCNANDTCGGSYFTCNSSCPAPSGADFDCHFCGDGTCNSDENASNCAADCTVCGDGLCTGAEDNFSCPQDCTPVCGDGVCDINNGEDCVSCPSDCPLC